MNNEEFFLSLKIKPTWSPTQALQKWKICSELIKQLRYTKATAGLLLYLTTSLKNELCSIPSLIFVVLTHLIHFKSKNIVLTPKKHRVKEFQT